MKKTSFLLLVFFFLFIIPQNCLSTNLLVIDSAAGEPYKTTRESMMQELESLGFTANVNLDVTYWTLGNADGMAKRVWLEEKDTSYDVIFLNGTIATLNFYKFAFDNPKYTFVFASVTDPVGIGVIDDFNLPPKANFTGVCYPVKIEERLRFIKRVMPNAKNIGYIYANMPQSQSYVKWLQHLLTLDEFNDLKFHFRSVQFVKGEGGHIRMAQLAEKHIKELNPFVDAFLSPNDQMGVQEPFARIISRTATKPLIGLGRDDVMEGWGATMAIYPSLENSGKQVAQMIYQLLTGIEIKQIEPQWPYSGVTFDLNKTRRFNISIPEDLVEKAGKNIVR